MTRKNLDVGRARDPGAGGRQDEDADSLNTFSYGRHGETEVTLAVVADGIGGRSGGERASETATDAMRQYFAEHGSAKNVRRSLEQAIHFANAEIFKKAKGLSASERSGTTVTAAGIANNRLYIANVGDSRIYLLRDGHLRQLSTDHTWAQEAIKAGRLSPEKAKTHPNRHVLTRSLGTRPKIEVDTSFDWDAPDSATLQQQGLPLEEKDTLLLCTDGLNDVVSDDDIQKILNRNDNPQRAADKLVNLALKRGGADNVTVQVLRVSGEKKNILAAIQPWGIRALIGASLVAIVIVALSVLQGSGGEDNGLPITDTPTTTATPVETVTATASRTATATMTQTPSPLPERPTGTATVTSTPQLATPPTPTRRPTRTPTNTPTRTYTPTATFTPMPTPTYVAPPPTLQISPVEPPRDP